MNKRFHNAFATLLNNCNLCVSFISEFSKGAPKNYDGHTRAYGDQAVARSWVKEDYDHLFRNIQM